MITDWKKFIKDAKKHINEEVKPAYHREVKDKELHLIVMSDGENKGVFLCAILPINFLVDDMDVNFHIIYGKKDLENDEDYVNIVFSNNTGDIKRGKTIPSIQYGDEIKYVDSDGGTLTIHCIARLSDRNTLKRFYKKVAKLDFVGWFSC